MEVAEDPAVLPRMEPGPWRLVPAQAASWLGRAEFSPRSRTGTVWTKCAAEEGQGRWDFMAQAEDEGERVPI